MRGSKDSAVGKGGHAVAGDSAGGYAGQMKAIMDARERELQIQAKAQALEAARKARAELSYEQVEARCLLYWYKSTGQVQKYRYGRRRWRLPARRAQSSATRR